MFKLAIYEKFECGRALISETDPMTIEEFTKEIVSDIPILLKPSMFGNKNYDVVIVRC